MQSTQARAQRSGGLDAARAARYVARVSSARVDFRAFAAAAGAVEVSRASASGAVRLAVEDAAGSAAATLEPDEVVALALHLLRVARGEVVAEVVARVLPR